CRGSRTRRPLGAPRHGSWRWSWASDRESSRPALGPGRGGGSPSGLPMGEGPTWSGGGVRGPRPKLGRGEIRPHGPPFLPFGHRVANEKGRRTKGKEKGGP